MLKRDSTRRLLALLLGLVPPACNPPNTAPRPPPPAGGPDPTGSWQVQLLLTSIAGQCSGTIVQNEFWTFVPDGPDSWVVEVQDFSGLTLGSLQAQQQGVELLMTGQLVVSGGVTVRQYESSGLYATPTALGGHMNLTRTGSIYCAQWGPVTGIRAAAPLTHAGSGGSFEGTLLLPDGDRRPARLRELEPELFQLAFEHAGRLVLSPPLPLAEDGSLRARFSPAGCASEYLLEARLEGDTRLHGRVFATSPEMPDLGWSAGLTLRRSTHSQPPLSR